MTDDPSSPLIAARLSSLISPLRRSISRAARSAEHLPEIPDAQIEVLRALPAAVELTSSELAGILGLSRPAVSNLLRAMEAEDLIVRRNDPEDGRRVLVTASHRAIDVLERFDRTSTAMLTDVLDRFDRADRLALENALDAFELLLDGIERMRQEGPPADHR